MNRLCLFLLFPLFVLNASFSELLKIPKLVSHFQHHQQRDNSVGFIDFINMHYFGMDINDNDDAEDMQLPFKNAEGQTIIQFAIPANGTLLAKAQSFAVESCKLPLRNYNHSNPVQGSLFKPPRA